MSKDTQHKSVQCPILELGGYPESDKDTQHNTVQYLRSNILELNEVTPPTVTQKYIQDACIEHFGLNYNTKYTKNGMEHMENL